MSEGPLSTEATEDAFLGDALAILQPRTGYRAGVDAVLLAASVSAPHGNAPLHILDAGAGVGVVGLCAARRLATARVVLVERELELAKLAARNIDRNGLQARVGLVAGDLTGKAALNRSADLQDETFDAVLANPPFHTTGQGTTARTPLKAAAHEMEAQGLASWVRFAARMARPGGTFTLIHKADATRDVLAAFAQRFGAIKLKPVYPRHGEPAIRVLVQGIKGSRARMTIAAPLILHGEGHAFTPQVDAILRHGAPLEV